MIAVAYFAMYYIQQQFPAGLIVCSPPFSVKMITKLVRFRIKKGNLNLGRGIFRAKMLIINLQLFTFSKPAIRFTFIRFQRGLFVFQRSNKYAI